MNSFVFLCVLSFFWRSYPQSNTPQQTLITNFWPDAPVNIDAAYESKQSDTVLLIKGMCSLNLPKTPNLIYFQVCITNPYMHLLGKYFLWISLQIVKCGLSVAMTLYLAILKQFPVLVCPKVWRKSMLLCMMSILARLCSLWAVITTGVFKWRDLKSIQVTDLDVTIVYKMMYKKWISLILSVCL